MKNQELSPFQRYYNYFTFYLFTLNVKYKNLEDYDEEGTFENHFKKFFKIKTELSHKIIDDDRLLINKSPFKEYFDSISNMDLNRVDILPVIKKFNKSFVYDKKEIQNLYFDLSDTLPKSKIRADATILLNWTFPAFVFALVFFLANIISAENWFDVISTSLIFIIPFIFLYFGLARKKALKQKEKSSFKFKYFLSTDYCFRRIKESEKFFFDVYKIDNDYYDISEIEIKFPEFGNLFERTINETKLSDSNREKLLIHNKNIYVRAVFSEFFELLLNEGIDQFQQIPFMFVATLNRANISVQGNTAFAECINNLLKTSPFTDVTFNQAKAKYTNEEDLFGKYRKILKKYENILQ